MFNEKLKVQVSEMFDKLEELGFADNLQVISCKDLVRKLAVDDDEAITMLKGVFLYQVYEKGCEEVVE